MFTVYANGKNRKECLFPISDCQSADTHRIYAGMRKKTYNCCTYYNTIPLFFNTLSKLVAQFYFNRIHPFTYPQTCMPIFLIFMQISAQLVQYTVYMQKHRRQKAGGMEI